MTLFIPFFRLNDYKSNKFIKKEGRKSNACKRSNTYRNSNNSRHYTFRHLLLLQIIPFL